MSIEIKEKAKSIIDELDDGNVREIIDFMLWLKDRREWEATREIMSIPGAQEKIEKGLADLEKGKTTLLRDLNVS